MMIGQESEYNKEQSGPVFPPFPPQNRMSPVAAQDKRMLPADEGESVRVRRLSVRIQICQKCRRIGWVTYDAGSRNLSFDFFDISVLCVCRCLGVEWRRRMKKGRQ